MKTENRSVLFSNSHRRPTTKYKSKLKPSDWSGKSTFKTKNMKLMKNGKSMKEMKMKLSGNILYLGQFSQCLRFSQQLVRRSHFIPYLSFLMKFSWYKSKWKSSSISYVMNMESIRRWEKSWKIKIKIIRSKRHWSKIRSWRLRD